MFGGPLPHPTPLGGHVLLYCARSVLLQHLVDTRRVEAVKTCCTGLIMRVNLGKQPVSREQERERALKLLDAKVSTICGLTNDALCLLSFF